MSRDKKLWAAVLAGGEGSRLASLTRALYREHLPKQFAVLDGDLSLLQRTIQRIEPLVPPERVVVVVGEGHAAMAKGQLARFPGVELVVQPAALGTGPGLLLPLARIQARDPDADVAVFPSDHFVRDPRPLLNAVEACARAARLCATLALVGAVPDHPEPDYGWIMPGVRVPRCSFQGVREVAQFVEKPPADQAERLLVQGGLWNTFVTVGPTRAFWGLARRHMPLAAELLSHYAEVIGRPAERNLLLLAYARMPMGNFSRDVLEQAHGLLVARAAGTGWSDWGCPRRVFESLQGSAAFDRLLARISRPGAPESGESRAL